MNQHRGPPRHLYVALEKLNVRFWHKADTRRRCTCPLSGVKRTRRLQYEMSANDPKRIFAPILFGLSHFSLGQTILKIYSQGY
jgi:hypothetical protein